MLRYLLSGGSRAEFEIWASAFSVSDSLTTLQDPQTKAKLDDLMANNLVSYQKKGQVDDMPLDVFDYRQAVNYWNISYIACRDSELIPKFANDPAFSLVFINDEVAIFMVKRSFS